MTQQCDESEIAPFNEFDFKVYLDGIPQVRVFGGRRKRNWVLWKLSQCVIALDAPEHVSVERKVNGAWIACDDWRSLSN